MTHIQLTPLTDAEIDEIARNVNASVSARDLDHDDSPADAMFTEEQAIQIFRDAYNDVCNYNF